MDIWGRAFQANAESSGVLAMSWGHGGQNAGPGVATAQEKEKVMEKSHRRAWSQKGDVT